MNGSCTSPTIQSAPTKLLINLLSFLSFPSCSVTNEDTEIKYESICFWKSCDLPSDSLFLPLSSKWKMGSCYMSFLSSWVIFHWTIMEERIIAIGFVLKHWYVYIYISIPTSNKITIHVYVQYTNPIILWADGRKGSPLKSTLRDCAHIYIGMIITFIPRAHHPSWTGNFYYRKVT